MTQEGIINIEWIKSPQQTRADSYRVTFESYRGPAHALFTRELKTEGEVRHFLADRIGCTEEAVAAAVMELGRRARSKINYIQLSDESLHELGAA
jgi:hypothetical protein